VERRCSNSGPTHRRISPIILYYSKIKILDYFTDMCGGSEAGSYLRLIGVVYHSTLGLRVKERRRLRVYGAVGFTT